MIIVCLLLLALSAWYVPARLKKMSVLNAVLPWGTAFLLFLAGYPLLLMSGAYTADNRLMAWLYNLYGLFFIFYVCFFLFLMAAHLLTPWLKKIPGRRMVTLGLTIAFMYVGFGFLYAQTFIETNFNISVKGLERPVKIAHIPDLHLGAQRGEAYLAKVITAVNARKPDIVLLNGDLVDSNIALRPALFSLFKNLTAETYFTLGNHEHYLNTPKALELIEGAGIKILHNEMFETHGLQLIGLEYMNADRATRDSHRVNDLTIEEELPKISRRADKASLLMHHSPVGLKYVAEGRIDIMLSGHTHGGQLFPGTLLAQMQFPLNKGLYKNQNTWFLVSQGAGTFGPWMRLGTSNEIQFITLAP